MLQIQHRSLSVNETLFNRNTENPLIANRDPRMHRLFVSQVPTIIDKDRVRCSISVRCRVADRRDPSLVRFRVDALDFERN